MARTMTVALGPHYEEFIQSAIVSGRYNNASEVAKDARLNIEKRTGTSVISSANAKDKLQLEIRPKE